MEYKKRIRVRVGGRPRRNARYLVLTLALILFSLGTIDFINSQVSNLTPPKGCFEKMFPLVQTQFNTERLAVTDESIRRQTNQLCIEGERGRLLNRGFYLTIPGAILFVISVFLP